jgi:hypothetical protein
MYDNVTDILKHITTCNLTYAIRVVVLLKLACTVHVRTNLGRRQLRLRIAEASVISVSVRYTIIDCRIQNGRSDCSRHQHCTGQTHNL